MGPAEITWVWKLKGFCGAAAGAADASPVSSSALPVDDMAGGTDRRLLRDAVRVRGSECETAGSSKSRDRSSSPWSRLGVGGRMEGRVGAISSGRFEMVANEAKGMHCLGGRCAEGWCCVVAGLPSSRVLLRAGRGTCSPTIGRCGRSPTDTGQPARSGTLVGMYFKFQG